MSEYTKRRLAARRGVAASSTSSEPSAPLPPAPPTLASPMPDELSEAELEALTAPEPPADGGDRVG